MPEVRRRWPHPDELILANDSVLGPIHPLAPVIDTMRAGGEGLFGLTESLQGGPHLQSYFLLARGKAAVADLMGFLQTLYVSHSKWLLVQMGEIRLARWMRRRGHRVAAVFGYDRLVQAAVADPAERRRLMGSSAKLRGSGPAARRSGRRAAARMAAEPDAASMARAGDEIRLPVREDRTGPAQSRPVAGDRGVASGGAARLPMPAYRCFRRIWQP